MFSKNDNQARRDVIRLRWIQKQEYWDQDTKTAHSHAYHRFFEGYSEETVKKENGRGTRIIRKYVGKYYQRECSNVSWILTKLMYWFMFAASAVLYLIATVQKTGINNIWYTALPGLLSVIAFIMLGVKLAGCTVAKRKMQAYEFKNMFGKLFLYSTVLAGLLLATGLAMLFYVLLGNGNRGFEALWPAFSCMAASILVFMIGLTEEKAKYRCLENDVRPSKNSVIIQEEL